MSALAVEARESSPVRSGATPRAGPNVGAAAPVNKTTIWNFSSKDTGPGVVNLNSSANAFVGPWPF